MHFYTRPSSKISAGFCKLLSFTPGYLQQNTYFETDFTGHVWHNMCMKSKPANQAVLASLQFFLQIQGIVGLQNAFRKAKLNFNY